MKLREQTDLMLKRYETVLSDVRNTGDITCMSEYIRDLEGVWNELTKAQNVLAHYLEDDYGFVGAIQLDIVTAIDAINEMINECEDYLATCKGD